MWKKVKVINKINKQSYTYYHFQKDQRSPEWLKARVGRVTASNANVASSGTSRFKTRDELADELCGIKKSFNSPEAIERMQHGIDNEPVALSHLIKLTNLKIKERGLCIPEDDILTGFSPDGIIDSIDNQDTLGTTTNPQLGDGLVEIKNPQKMYFPLLQHQTMIEHGFIPDKYKHDHIYDSHYDQIQLSLHISKREWCIYFVFISEENYYKEIVYYNRKYTTDVLLPGINYFIANYLLPRLKRFRLKVITPTEFDIDDLTRKYQQYVN